MDHKGIAHALLQKPFTLGSANVNVSFGRDVNWPEGLIRACYVRVWANTAGTALGGGAGAAGGPITLIRSFNFQTMLHKTLYNTVDGKLWNRFVKAMRGIAPPSTDASASGFSQWFPIYFSWPATVRHSPFRLADSALLNFKGMAKPQLDISLGPITDIITGGSPTCTGFVDVVVEYEPNPVPGKYDALNPSASGDEPGLQVDIQQALISALGSQPYAQLNTGQGRGLAALAFREEQPGTPPTEQSDIFTANTSKLQLTYGPDHIADGIPVTDLDQMATDFFDLALTAGFHIYLPVKDGKMGDVINCRDGRALQAAFDNIATSSSRELQLLPIYLRDVEAGATWDAQMSAAGR